MSRTAYDVQRDFALSCGLQSQIIWDSLGPNESDILKEKIKALLPINDPQEQKVTEKMRKVLFDSVWMQRKYTNRMLMSTIIYVLVTKECDVNMAKRSEKFSCHPVFRTRKCINSENQSHGCCMVFVDETGRVYKNWKHYVMTNNLPKGTMIAPANGIYVFTNDDEISLEVHLTPAAHPKQRILNTTDTFAGVSSLAAVVPLTAALVFPISAPVMAAATAVTLTTGAYSTVRSAMQLTDRGKHEQSLALTDREARGNWLGLASGTVGLSASGATMALSYAATAGRQISLGAKIAVNGMNYSSLLISGSGVVSNIYDVYMTIHDDGYIAGINFLHLANSLLIFTHSINNLKIVKNISKASSGGASFRSQLTSEMRNLLKNLSSNSATVSSGLTNNRPSIFSSDIMRIVNAIPSREILLDLHNTNTNLSARVVITSGLTHTLQTLISKWTHDISGSYFLQLVEKLGYKFVQHIVNSNSLLDVLSAMSKYFCEAVSKLLLNLVRTFLEENVDKLDRFLSTFISTENVLYKMFMHCIQNYSRFTYEFLESKTAEILNSVEGYYESLSPYSNGRNDCDTCKGYFFVSPL